MKVALAIVLGHLLLEPVAAEEPGKGGLYLPETAREAPHECVVRALPRGGSQEAAVGDRVPHESHAGQEVTFDGEKNLLVPVGDLLAKYVEADAIPT